MKILLIHQGFCTPDQPGSTRHFELCRYLVKKGHKVTVVGSTVNPQTLNASSSYREKFFVKEINEGVEILRVFSTRKPKQNFRRRILSYLSFMVISTIGSLRVGTVDMVIACSPQIFTGISGFLVSRLRNIPFIFEVRDLWPDFAIEEGILRGKLKILMARELEKFLYGKAHHLIINSPGYFDHLIKCGVNRGRITLISNGVDTEIYNPDERGHELRKQLQLVGKFVVLYAGAHGQANNLDTLVEAARLLEDKDDINFLLVGGGPEKERLISLARSYGLHTITFMDPQPREKMPEVYAASDVCLAILKAHYKTTYPNKIFDYMGSGRPVILAINGVAREVIEDAAAGLYVKPERPAALAMMLLDVYQNREVLEYYGANGRQYVEKHFDRKMIAEKFHQTLIRIMEN